MGIMLFAVIGGLLAISRLPVDAEPDVPIPFVNIQVTLPGISPEDSERLLIRPLETELKSIEGLKQMDGVAATNVASLTLEFEADHDLDLAIAVIDLLAKPSTQLISSTITEKGYFLGSDVPHTQMRNFC